MEINRETTVIDLKNTFTNIYPFLSLRIYSKMHDHYEGSPNKEEVSDDKLLMDINPNIEDGRIVISDSLTVDRLETLFSNKFGLAVQVFRKSGDQWLQTTATDDWTLAKQNDKAADFDTFLSTAK